MTPARQSSTWFRPALVASAAIAVAGVIVIVIAEWWNSLPSDGANIGAGLLFLLGAALLTGGVIGSLATLTARIFDANRRGRTSRPPRPRP